MSVITEFSIPAEEFVLGRALQESEELSVELDQMIPTSETTVPYVWVVGEGRDEFDAVLDGAPELSDFEVVDELDDRTLYRVEWAEGNDTFLQAIVVHDVALLEADGDADAWEFQLRFPDSHSLSEFHTACRDAGIDLTVQSLYNPVEPETVDVESLTEGQRELILRAYEEGYFEVPRKVTLVELADELGLSGQSVNERLRRGLNNLVRTTLEPERSDRE